MGLCVVGRDDASLEAGADHDRPLQALERVDRAQADSAFLAVGAGEVIASGEHHLRQPSVECRLVGEALVRAGRVAQCLEALEALLTVLLVAEAVGDTVRHPDHVVRQGADRPGADLLGELEHLVGEAPDVLACLAAADAVDHVDRARRLEQRETVTLGVDDDLRDRAGPDLRPYTERPPEGRLVARVAQHPKVGERRADLLALEEAVGADHLVADSGRR